MRSCVLAGCLLLLAVGCGDANGSSSAAQRVFLTSPSAPPTPLYNGGYCALPETTEVITDAVRWGAIWAALACGSPPPMRMLDFTTHMLVLVSLGHRPSAGYGLSIESADVGPDGVLHVIARESCPDPHGAQATVVTFPVAVARISRSSAPAEFALR